MRAQLTRFSLSTTVELDDREIEREFVFRYGAGRHTWSMRSGVEGEGLVVTQPGTHLRGRLDGYLEVLQERGPGLRLEFRDMQRLERLCAPLV